MVASSWFECDNRKSRNLSVSISPISIELFMRLRLVSVVGKLWSGEQFVDHDVQCFHSGHCYSMGYCFRVRDHCNAFNLYVHEREVSLVQLTASKDTVLRVLGQKDYMIIGANCMCSIAVRECL